MRTDEAAKETDRSSREPGHRDEQETRPATTDDASDERTETSELPILPSIIDRVAQGVRARDIIGVLVFDATPLESWEHRHGPEAFDDLIERFGEAASEMCGSAIRRKDIVCRNAAGGGSVLIFLSRPRSDPQESDSLDFDTIADRTKEYAIGALGEEGELEEVLERIQVGTSLIVGKDSVDPRRQVYRAIRRARNDIRARERKRIEQLHQVVGSVIAQRDIETLYQPIVQLTDQCPIGFEALSRVGTDRSCDLDDPLFSAAAKVELEAELDQICRTLSVDRRPELEEDKKLFVNCLPAAFYDPNQQLETLLDEWLEHERLDPDQLIFEINEDISQSEADRILPTIRRLRRSGFQFALDDMGTGKTNLRLLADLEPTYIKMDISLTRGIADSVRKQALASYLLDLAEKSDAELIAEGVESQRDLETVVELGVEYAQGHLIGRPGEEGEFI